MFYKFFVTTVMLFLIHISVKAKPEWKDNKGNIYKAMFCLIFMCVQSLCIAGFAMVIYGMWR